MKTLTACAAALAAATVVMTTVGAQPAADAPMRLATLAWDRGDYVSALTTYAQLLDGPDAEKVLEPIALQTGELFVTTELTTDGSAPQFSPDGRFITYETGAGPSRTIRLLATADPGKPVVELHGFGAAFSLDTTKLAYLKVPASLTEVYAELDRAPQAERVQRIASLNARVAAESQVVIRDLSNGSEVEVETASMRKTGLGFGAGGMLLVASLGEAQPQQVYSVAPGNAPVALTSGEGDKSVVAVNATGTAAVISVRTAGGGRGGGGRGGAGPGAGRGGAFGVLTLPEGKLLTVPSVGAPSFSADGKSLTFVAREQDDYRVMVAPASDPAAATVVRKGPERAEAPALSPDGTRVVYQLMTRDDWEIYVAARDGTGETRLTREIQHDLLPEFLDSTHVLAVMGEARHRRSYLYDAATGQRTRLFHNNTVRTIAPEYAWAPSADGTKLLIVAERDGNTVSPDRGVYLMDLARKVTKEQLRARVAANLAAEQALRAHATHAFGPIVDAVKTVVAEASVARVFGYEKTLFDFDSKHISRPGNKLASAFLYDTYKSFGYEPEFQWFEPRGALDGRTANVVATLEGTVNPELVYVVSSHYDSVAAGPGADDDSSGTAALLETARILAKHPQPATIVFASFTGEEAGLLGSREFVRRAVENKLQIVGALNNDMVGWANDYRLDNTIRYSNPGIRDIQHGAAMQFTNLITYDALYYKSTDAAAYFEAYGDIVGGIGSYPVLGNPHYHQSHDFLEGINHQLVTEVAKTTAATLMLLASSPSRLSDLKVDSFNGGTAAVSWKASPEKSVTGYLVAYGPPEKPEAQQIRVAKPAATISKVTPGTLVAVKAMTDKGLEGWDWARVRIEGK
jgi:peptidase M28-like protein/WD40 repeat protein